MTQWENASDQVAIGFDFISDLFWTNQRSKQSRSKAKPMQFRITLTLNCESCDIRRERSLRDKDLIV